MSSTFEFGDWIFLLTSVFEMIIFCGFQSGWSSLVYVLVEEGIYSHLCVEQSSVQTANASSFEATPSNATNNCPAQQEMLNLAYTLATSISAMAAFPIGIAVDYVGPRIVRVMSGLTLGLSSLLLSYLTKNNPFLLFPGLLTASIAILVIYMTPQTCTHRFKKGRSIIIGIYCGCWVASSSTFLGFKIIYEQGGVRFAHFFRFLAVSCVFVCVNAALLYPDNISTLEKGKQSTNKDSQCNMTHAKHLKKLSELRRTLGKCKSCIGVTDENSIKKNRTIMNTNDHSEERNQLLTNETPSIENSCKYTDCELSEKFIDNDVILTTNSNTVTGKFPSPQIKTVSSVSIHEMSSSYIPRKSCDFTKLKYTACPSVDTNTNCLKTVLSRTSEAQEIKRGDQEDTEPDGQSKSMEVKPCRSNDLQAWTARSAEVYLRSGLSFKHCVFSSVHIWAEIFLIACKLRLWFYVGTFTNHISELSGGDRETVTKYVTIFGLSNLGALVFAPLFGIIVGRRSGRGRREYVSPSSETEKSHQKFMMGIEDTTKAVEFIIKCNKESICKLNDAVLVTACAAVVFCLLSVVPNLSVQIITFQLYTFLRVSYNALFPSIVMIVFPPNHLGKIMGLASFLGAAFSLIQYPLFIIMEEWFGGRILEVNIGLWLTCMLTFGLPIYLWRKASSVEPNSLALVAV